MSSPGATRTETQRPRSRTDACKADRRPTRAQSVAVFSQLRHLHHVAVAVTMATRRQGNAPTNPQQALATRTRGTIEGGGGRC